MTQLPLPLPWLDLLTEGDAHPRRFWAEQDLTDHLRRAERLAPEATAQLLAEGQTGPPLARRSYRLRGTVRSSSSD
ncbi:hypothetical protein [Deinococcus radiophilus]|uniref:Uncharacterized protein n=1 Tax=Deinococcus radiophilus TaxID=32062 RepID=A0A3S0RH69_9DEIO|nr:hypothetical protein [Deinococcus radiophilus]RTR28305.1 hypothetical protein EJ104_05170 [Deinococcus radiophilus]UFA51167.1 hypothetical protein LMT64_04525 [Deinococcus radiophilus]